MEEIIQRFPFDTPRYCKLCLCSTQHIHWTWELLKLTDWSDDSKAAGVLLKTCQVGSKRVDKYASPVGRSQANGARKQTYTYRGDWTMSDLLKSVKVSTEWWTSWHWWYPSSNQMKQTWIVCSVPWREELLKCYVQHLVWDTRNCHISCHTLTRQQKENYATALHEHRGARQACRMYEEIMFQQSVIVGGAKLWHSLNIRIMNIQLFNHLK